MLFYRDRLNNEHWGEQVKVRKSNTLQVSMVFQGMRASEAEQVWQPLREWVAQKPDAYTIKVQAFAIPGEKLAVSTEQGVVVAPVELAQMPEGVVWLPTNARGYAVRATLGAGHGSIVRLTRADAPPVVGEGTE